MTSDLFRAMATFGATVMLVLTPQLAGAQEDGPAHAGIGGLGAIGLPGGMTALRVSAVGESAGFDIDFGLLSDGLGGRDGFASAQLRFMPFPRKADGSRKAFLIGLNSGGALGPGRQIGMGTDWVHRRLRVGLDLVMGSHGIFGQLFFVWGRNR